MNNHNNKDDHDIDKSKTKYKLLIIMAVLSLSFIIFACINKDTSSIKINENKSNENQAIEIYTSEDNNNKNTNSETTVDNATEKTKEQPTTTAEPTTTQPTTTAEPTTKAEPTTAEPTTEPATKKPPAPQQEQPPIVTIDPKEYADEVLRLVNIERAKENLPALEGSKELGELASIRANEIIELFEHIRPNGTNFDTVADGKGLDYNFISENIAAGYSTPQKVVEGWMNSDGHRANILRKEAKFLGVGYIYKQATEYKHYFVQLFMG